MFDVHDLLDNDGHVDCFACQLKLSELSFPSLLAYHFSGSHKPPRLHISNSAATVLAKTSCNNGV